MILISVKIVIELSFSYANSDPIRDLIFRCEFGPIHINEDGALGVHKLVLFELIQYPLFHITSDIQAYLRCSPMP